MDVGVHRAETPIGPHTTRRREKVGVRGGVVGRYMYTFHWSQTLFKFALFPTI